jgi:hypothetical protein
MTEKKRPPPREDVADPAHAPTRKVESMSALVADILLREQDGGAGRRPRSPSSPGDAESDARADRAALDLARLIEVRADAPRPSQPPPRYEPAPPPPRSRVPMVVGVVFALVALAALVALLATR